MALIIIVDQVINKTGMVDTSEEGFQRVLDNTDVKLSLFQLFHPYNWSFLPEKDEKNLQTVLKEGRHTVSFFLSFSSLQPDQEQIENYLTRAKNLQGNFAFIHDASEVKYEFYNNCNFTEVGLFQIKVSKKKPQKK